MTIRQDKAVSVYPVWLLWIMSQYSAVQNVRQWSKRHRCSLMTTLGCKRRIHGNTTDEGYGLTVNVGA
jgi:hypothetical protein